ncbi:MAG TPA: hypothetical protein DEO65_01465 [Bacillus bacterium]|uniref:Small heat shock protein n=1 Tax=Siminovitchia fordii TaxID=254759 RepID=A0ABQ4K580_9BACI|nr:hypothetical protein [Siminovitchia fordii]GIN20881.1 hypothetical protein J1TS3_20150 [Siminovitchia fordii]HBZ08535.1 hypothetical protein [Bacillus sp. (in: firmicutes)]
MLPFPFSKGGLPKWLSQNYFNNDIQKFVHEVMEQSISTSLKNAKMMGSMYMDSQEERKPLEEEKESESKKEESIKESLQAMTFDSLDHVYVKVLLTDSSLLSHIKIYHNSNQLILEGIPAREDRHVITLPSTVTMKDTVSEYRDPFLQIKMKKRNDPQFAEIAVPPLE